MNCNVMQLGASQIKGGGTWGIFARSIFVRSIFVRRGLAHPISLKMELKIN